MYHRKGVNRALALLSTLLSIILGVGCFTLPNVCSTVGHSLGEWVRRYNPGLLVEDDILEPVRNGRIVTLRLKIEKSVVIELGKDIFPSHWDEFLDNIHDLFKH